MRYLVRAATEPERAAFCGSLRLARTPDFRAIVAVDVHGRVRGAVGYDRWTANAAEMHLALETPAAGRALLPVAFAYPLEHRGVVYAWVRASNRRSVRLCTHLGFRWCGTVPDGAEVGDDMLLFQMRREDCRWIASDVRKAA